MGCSREDKPGTAVAREDFRELIPRGISSPSSAACAIVLGYE